MVALTGFWQIRPSLYAATLTWDTVAGDAGSITGGAGTWTNGLGGWNTGGGDTTWNNATPDSAIFGGTAGTVTLGGAVTVGNMVFNSGYSLADGGNALTLLNSTITANSAATISAALSGSTGLIKDGAATLTLSGTSSYTGPTVINAGVLSTTSLANGGSNSNIGASSNAASNLVLNGGTLQYNTTGSTDRLFSVGTSGGTISMPLVGTLNLTNTGNIGFNGQSGARTVTFAFSDNPSNGGNLVLSSAITDNGGATSLVKANSFGILRLASNNNTYTGTTTINGGSVSIGNLGGSTGSIGSGNIIINGSGTLSVSRSGTVNLTQTISGTGGVILNGSAALTMSGTNTYTGGNNILGNGGVMIVSDIGNGGVPSGIGASSSAASNLLITTFSTLRYVGTGASTDRLFSLSGGASGVGTIDSSGSGALVFANTGAIALGAAGTRTLILSGTNTQNNTMTPVIGDNSGATAITKSGTGTWVVAGANSYTGVTTVSGGVLAVSSLANGGSNSNIGAATNAASNLVLNGGTLQYTGAAVSTDRLFSVGTSGGTIDSSGTGAVNFANTGSMGFNGQLGLRILTLTGTNTGANTIAAVIGDNTGATSLTKTGTGTWVLTGANSYSNPTTINGGVLSVALLANGVSNSNIGASGNVASNLVLNGGTLQYTGGAVSTDRLFSVGTGGGTIDSSGTGGINFTNGGSMGFVASGTRTLTLTGSYTGTNIINAVIGNNGNNTSLTVSGAGTWTMNGSNTYSGVTTINGGVLNVITLANGGSASGIGNSSNISSNLVLNGGTLRFSGSSASTDRLFSVGTSGGTLESSGVFAVNFTNTGSMGFNGQSGVRTLTLGGINSADNTLAAMIGDSGGATAVTKTGSGIWVLSGTNTYTGVTTLTNGELKVSTLTNGGIASGMGAATNAASNLVFNGGNLNYTGAATSTDRLFSLGTAGGNINVSGSGGVNFTNTGAMGFNGQTGARLLDLGTSNGGTSTIAALIGDNGGATGVRHVSTGTWALTGANTYTGITLIGGGGVISVSSLANGGSASGIGAATNDAANLLLNGGTLQYTGAGASTDRLFSISNSGATLDASGTGTVNFTNTGAMAFMSAQTSAKTLTLTGTNTGSNTLAAAIGDNVGATSLTKSGAGTWALTGSNSYSGTTTISAGVLQIGNGGTSGTLGSGGVTDNANLTFKRSDSLSVANTISGTGSVTQAGTGTTTLSATNTYTGATSVTAGTLSITSIANGGSASNIGASTNAATNLVLNGGTLQYTGGAGTTDRLFSVGTSGGTLDSSGSFGITFSNSGSMGFNGQSGARTLTLTGTSSFITNQIAAVIGDNGGATSLVKNGTGGWVITGTNTYTGTTTIDSGSLTVGANGSTGTLGSGNIINNGQLMFLRTGTLTMAQNISGSGRVVQGGSATVTMSGTNTYTGPTLIAGGGVVSISSLGNGGSASGIGAATNDAANIEFSSVTATLKYTGAATSTDRLFSIDVGAGAVLDASGTGAINFTNTGAMGLTPGGASPRKLTLTGSNTGNNTLAAAVGESGVTTSVTKSGNGTWLLTGANTYTGTTTISGGKLVVTSLADGGSASNLGAASNAASNLVLNAATLQYTGTGSSTDRLFSIGTGSGSLDASGTGAINFTNTGAMGFNGQSGTRGLSLFGTGLGSIAAAIGDNGGATSILVNATGGIWTLTSAASTYTGTTRVFFGTLAVSVLADGGAASSIGASSNSSANLWIDGGTLKYIGGAASTDRLFAVGTSNGTLDASGTGAINFTNTGSMGFNSTGSRTLTLTGTNTGDNTLAAVIADNSGATTLSKMGAGKWVITGNNTYTGVTNINAGTLQVGNGGTSGTLGTGTATIGSALIINRSDAVTITNAIGGTGTFTQAGTGTTTFSTGTKSYTGGTFVNAGKLQAGSANAFSTGSAVTVASGAVLEVNGFNPLVGGLSGAGTVQNGAATGATLNIGGSANSSFDGLIQNGGSGFMSINKGGAGGTLTLTGSNTYTGGTVVSAGTLSVSNLANGGVASNIGASSNAAFNLILTGGALSYTGAAVSTDRLFSVTTSGGTLDASGTGAINFTNTGSMGFNSQTGARTLTLSGNNTGANTIAAVIGDNSGATSLSKLGVGTWVLTGANTYTGTTSIVGGVLQVGSGGTTGNLGTGNVSGSGSLVINRSDSITVSNAISGTVSLTQAGTGTTILTGTNNYGSTTISAGTLQIGNGGTTGTLGGIGTITNNGKLIINRSDAITLAGAMSGTGEFIQNGTGTTTLTNFNQWGSATVNAGILTALATNSLGTNSPMTVNAAGTLVISGLGSSALIGSLAGAGTVKNGGATASTIAIGGVTNGATTFSGTIIDGGTGTMGLDKMSANYTLTLSGASTYTGLTRIFAGTLIVTNLADGGSASSIGASSSAASNLVFKTGGAVLKYTGAAVSTDRLFSITGGTATLDASGTGALNFTNTGAMGFDGGSGARTLTLSGTNTDNNTLAAAIGDNGGATSLAKSGVGTWVLTGNNTYTGTTNIGINGGVLQVGAGGTTGTLGSGAVTNLGILIINRSDAITVGNTIGGTGILTQAGAGTTTLSGTNTYTGRTIINAGVLSVSSLANGGSNSNLGASINAATNLVLNGGALKYTGAATSTDRLFSVGTSGGTLDASGTGAIAFTNTGSMAFNSQGGVRTLTLTGTNTGSNTLAAVIGNNVGATSLVKSDVGTWVLTGTNTYTGTTTISGGVLQVGDGGTAGTLGSGAVTNNASLVINRSNAITVANTISGSGSLTQAGGGTMTLSGANTYTGSTVINSGVLSVAALANGGVSSNIGASTSAASNLVLNGGTLQYTGAAATTDRLFSVGTSGGTVDASGTGAVNFNNTGSMGFNGQTGARTLTLTGTNTGSNTLAAAIGDNSGATALVKSGTGTWVLTGTNSYSGTTMISAGTLQVGDGNTTGTLGSGTVTNNAALVINRSDAITVANAISGTGSFTQAGAGTTTLSGTNSYTGVTTITSGVLNVTTLANGGSSSGIGASSNAASNLVINGGTLQYTGSSNVSTDRLFSVGLGSAVIDVSGTGTVNFTNTGAMGFNGQSGARNLLLTGTNTSGPNIIAAAIGDFGGATSVTIDGAATWLLTGANTFTGATTLSSGVLQIGGGSLVSALIIGANATLELNGLNSSIGSLAGSGIVQNNGATAATLTLGGNNADTTFSGIIRDGGAGAFSLEKAGRGTFTLTGANTYSGTTTIDAGVLQVGSGGTTGALGTGAVTNNAQLTINRSNGITVGNDISGNGSLTQAGAGTTTLSGNSSYTGSTTINGGVLSVSVLGNGGANSNIGASTNAAGNLVLNGGTLQYTGAAVSTDRLFSVGTNGGTVDASGTGAVNFTNTGSMGFNGQSGIRTLTLTGTNTGSNTLAAAIGDNGGATSLTKSGVGTWVLTGANSYTGATVINAGVLQIGSGGTTGALGSGAVTNNGSLVLNRSDAIAVANDIGGSGSLTQAGGGTTTLSGNNSYSGGTTINAGVVSVAVLADGGSSSNIGASSNVAGNLVLNGGGLQYTGAAVSTDRLFSVGTNGGTVDASGTGSVNFTNTGSVGFNGQSGARTLTLTGANTGNNTLAAGIADNGGATMLVKSGTGTWVLTGNNAYTGTSTINAGELQIGSGGTTGALGTGDVTNNGSLVLNRSDAISVANAISGSGSLTQAGAGTTTLSGSSSYTGSTTINSGVVSVSVLANGGASSNIGASTNAAGNLVINGSTLQYTGGAVGTDRLFSVGTGGGTLDASGTGAVNFTNTGSVGFNGSGARTLTLTGSNADGNTLAAVIGDNGGATTLTKTGAGTWVLSGANSYTGSTTISGGTLQIGDGGTTGSLSVSSALSNDGTLVFKRFDAMTQGTDFAGLIRGSGAVTQAGSGTLTLNASNTYAGATSVKAGTLTVTSNEALGTSAAGTTVSSGATLLLKDVNYSTAEALTLNGSGVSSGGALRNSGTSTYTGQITAATDASINTGGGVLTLTGGLVKDGTVLTITGGGTVYVSGTGISGASANSDLVVDGTTLVVSADSDYNGPTTVKNSAMLVANAAIATTKFDLSSNSTLVGTGSITTAVNQDILINGLMTVGDPAVAPVATSFALTTSGTGAVVLGAGSVIQLDLFSGAGAGNNLSNAAAADSINLHGKLDATAGGTVVVGNPNGMTHFHGGDQWQLFNLNTGSANEGSIAGALALNDSSLGLASGVTSHLDQSTGIFSVIDTNGGLATAAVEGQALISGGTTVTADLNGHLFNLRAGGGEEEDDASSGSITAALDEGVLVGEGDGDPKKKDSPVAKRVPHSRQWEVFATVNYGNVKLNPIRTQSGVQVDSWASGAGVERHFTRGLTVGFAASFLQSTQGYTGNAGSLYLEGPALSTYVSYVRGGLWNSLLYSFGTYQMDSTRNPGAPFPVANGSTRAYTHSIQYNSGWNFRFQNNTLVTGPFIGLDYLHGSVNAYNETGGGLAALHYNSQSFQSLVSRIGWSASKKFETSFATITPQLRLSYERQNIRNNNGTSVSLLNVPFSSTAGNQNPGQDYLVAGFGVNFAFTQQFSMMLSYQGQFFRHDLQAHFGSVRFSYRF
ncbi:autotransporter-associated beta strand repeat-containing protein [Prosthecobacter sp.]|uniref:autotransporter-associated beta strand repeat-containing protein n=1 Tax=Prosthecobacter sp. TaxID=1965333 RepID=UPI00378388CF